MLRLPDAWVWDSWYVHDGERFHAFFLKASRALVDPELRHRRPGVGHAVSDDLVSWTVLPDALVSAEPGAFDDQGIWTGSIVRDDDDRWHLLYTGIDRSTGPSIQRIGHAVSEDLLRWERVGDRPCVVADPRWYATHAVDGDEPWRDPWVLREGDGWRMLVTAKTPGAGATGCIATAVSPDLFTWTVEPPLAHDLGLGQLEVLQVVEVDGRWVTVFCCDAGDVQRPGLPLVRSTWTMPCASPTGPFDVSSAEPIDVSGNYAGRVVMRDGAPTLMAFMDVMENGDFGGFLLDPVPLTLTGRGTLQPGGR